LAAIRQCKSWTHTRRGIEDTRQNTQHTSSILALLLISQGCRWPRKWVPYMGALSAAGWVWSGRGRVRVAGWAWSLHGKQTWIGNC